MFPACCSPRPDDWAAASSRWPRQGWQRTTPPSRATSLGPVPGSPRCSATAPIRFRCREAAGRAARHKRRRATCARRLPGGSDPGRAPSSKRSCRSCERGAKVASPEALPARSRVDPRRPQACPHGRHCWKVVHPGRSGGGHLAQSECAGAVEAVATRSVVTAAASRSRSSVAPPLMSTRRPK